MKKWMMPVIACANFSEDLEHKVCLCLAGAFFEWALVDLTTSYGFKPWRIVATIFLVVVAGSLLFAANPQAFESDFDGSLAASFRLSLSRLTGASLDRIRIHPNHWVETAGILESFLGVFVSALFVGTLTRKLAR
jgi:hypothetical protein